MLIRHTNHLLKCGTSLLTPSAFKGTLAIDACLYHIRNFIAFKVSTYNITFF